MLCFITIYSINSNYIHHNNWLTKIHFDACVTSLGAKRKTVSDDVFKIVQKSFIPNKVI